MSADSDQFDFFVSYARNDNADGWITRFITELAVEHAKFAPDRPLKPFFDKQDIRSLDDWQHRIFNDGLAKSRLFIAFISPNYFASEWCRREWKAWIDTEIAKHILSAGAAPIYLVEVPGFVGKVSGLSEQKTLGEQEVSRKIAELCGLPAPYDGFIIAASPIVRQMRERRQVTSDFVKPFADEGIAALRREDLRRVLLALAYDLDERTNRVRQAAESETTVPPYNKKFSGRLDELLALRERLKDDRTGVITGVHGLGGIGKTELAFTYSHAFASAYPGGRFLVPCEGRANLRDAALVLGDLFRDRISDEERKTAETYFAAITTCLRDRLDRLGHILLVLDNVSDQALLTAQQTDCLTTLGPKLHLLATTRLAPPTSAKGNWLTLGELPEADALDLLEKHRPFVTDLEREAARRIVKRLGGFALAVELVAAWLAVHEQSSSYAKLTEGLGLEDLEEIASEEDVQLRRHNHERRLTAVLGPMLTGLKPAERRTLEYAALLPPDCVPLPWLKILVSHDFPELSELGKRTDPWIGLCEHLIRLAVFSSAEGESNQPRLVRIHRLVQSLIVRKMSSSSEFLMDSLLSFTTKVVAEMGYFWHEENRRWEILSLVQFTTALIDRKEVRGATLAAALGFPLARLTLPTDSVVLLEEAIQLLKSKTPNEKAILFKLKYFLGEIHGRRGEYEKADLLIREAAQGRQELLGATHQDTLLSVNNIGWLLSLQGRDQESEPYFRQAMVGLEQALGPVHYHTLASVNNVAGIESDKGNVVKAIELYRRVFDGMRETLGIRHPDTLIAACNLASNLESTGEFEEAEQLLLTALNTREEVLGDKHPETLESVSFLANYYFETKDLIKAESLFRRAFEGRSGTLGVAHPNTATSAQNLVLIMLAKDEIAEAETIARDYVICLVAKYTNKSGLNSQLETALNTYAAVLAKKGMEREEIIKELRRIAPDAFTDKPTSSDLQAAQQEISPQQARSLALELFKKGEYKRANQILLALLNVGFEIVSTRLHIARIALITDDIAVAHEQTAQAWAKHDDVEPYILGRMYWFKIALAIIDDGDSALARPEIREFIEQLKAKFRNEQIHMDWIMQPVLDHLKSKISDKSNAFLTAIAAALSKRTEMSILEECPEWTQSKRHL